MPTLAEAVAVLYPNAVPLEDYLVRKDGAGVTSIAAWKPTLGEQPTQAQLDAVTDAQVAATLKAKRDTAAPDLAAMRDAAAQALADLDAALTATPGALNTNALVVQAITDLRGDVRKLQQISKRLIKTEVFEMRNTV